MNKDKLREEIAEDEGCKFEIYLDHLGLPTYGIGHLVVEGDPEYGQPVGTPVDEERVRQVFSLDIAVTIEDCKILFDGFDDYPEECQHILANMMFNMGRTRLSGFKNFRAALEEGDWERAGKEGRDSKWYRQVTNRAERLMERLENV